MNKKNSNIPKENNQTNKKLNVWKKTQSCTDNKGNSKNKSS